MTDLATTHGFDSNRLSHLLAAACASLETDCVAARACIQQATELLRTGRGVSDTGESAFCVVRGGLAPWQQKRVAAYVEANIASNIRIPDLAHVVHSSTGHFFRAFRASFGESPLAYVMRRRIQHSQKLMVGSRAPLCQIALECGMCDQAHFTRVFRRIVGVNPGLWRRQAGPPDIVRRCDCE
jgi:transcriptional regulator GlxA family with amidase domain